MTQGQTRMSPVPIRLFIASVSPHNSRDRQMGFIARQAPVGAVQSSLRPNLGAADSVDFSVGTTIADLINMTLISYPFDLSLHVVPTRQG
jgi:hypothetical protein